MSTVKSSSENLTLNADGAGNDVVIQSNGTTTAIVTAEGLLQYNSGYCSVATAYCCRAWVKFNGSGTVAINNSANVSSITDLGTGRYRVNFTTAMVDADFAAVSSNANRDGGCYGHSTTDVGVFAGESAVDSTIISVAIFR